MNSTPIRRPVIGRDPAGAPQVADRPFLPGGLGHIAHCIRADADVQIPRSRRCAGRGRLYQAFEEKVSGAKRDRPALARMLDHLRTGDVVTITSLDRLPDRRPILAIAERIRRPAQACVPWLSRRPTRRLRPAAWC